MDPMIPPESCGWVEDWDCATGQLDEQVLARGPTLWGRSISEEIHNNWRSSISWMQSEPSTWNDAALGQLDGRGMINENVDPISHYHH